MITRPVGAGGRAASASRQASVTRADTPARSALRRALSIMRAIAVGAEDRGLGRRAGRARAGPRLVAQRGQRRGDRRRRPRAASAPSRTRARAPGARPIACIAASITIVPAPHIGSTSAVSGRQPASASRPAASVSRSGAAPVSTRAPRRCRRSPDASALNVKRSSTPRSSRVTSASSSRSGGARARDRIRDGQHRRLRERAGVIQAAVARARARGHRRPGARRTPARAGARRAGVACRTRGLPPRRRGRARASPPATAGSRAGRSPADPSRRRRRSRPRSRDTSGSASSSSRATSSRPGATTANQRSVDGPRGGRRGTRRGGGFALARPGHRVRAAAEAQVGEHLDGAAAARHRRIEMIDDLEAEPARALAHLGQRFVAQARGVGAGGLHTLVGKLELGLHEHDPLGARAQSERERAQHVARGHEADIDREEIERSLSDRERQPPPIHAFQRRHAWVSAQRRMQLPVPDVGRQHAVRPVRQQRLREAARRRPDVDRARAATAAARPKRSNAASSFPPARLTAIGGKKYHAPDRVRRRGRGRLRGRGRGPLQGSNLG